MRKPFKSTRLLLWIGFLLFSLGGTKGLLGASNPRAKLKLPGRDAQHFLKAVDLEDQQQYDQAIREYQAYLKARPNVPYASYYLGNLYYRLGRTEEGKEQFRKAASARPG